MNGSTWRMEGEGAARDRKPVITCAGELEVFSGLEDQLSMALPQEPCEWRRSLGRPVRSVHIGVRFTPFSPEALPKDSQWDLVRHPLFHIYWTECGDVDAYRSGVREDLEAWLRELTTRNITDWLVVVVETFDVKRHNKLLPRTTVLDKIRADFAPKQGDRCISVLNPVRQEHRTADSWRGLVARVRYLVLVAYARAVSRLEEHVRGQRERRNEPGWHFTTYFRLQEELALVLEMLGLHDEALVQYDELDALFSQFVVNGHAGDAAGWLSEFQQPLDRWHGLRLGVEPSLPERPSPLELRAYLFARQARALLAAKRPWEMAARCLPFLHACVRELGLLEVSAAVPGAVHCWLFLAALEVLHECERYSAEQAEQYSLHTAALWAYASRKLRQLGELCGLMPPGQPTSEQLHLVVGLSAGMGDCPGELPQRPSPTDKLKEALCSPTAFNRHYLELSELAMGTYKHVGRLRSARLVGRELASFYRLLGETQKAAAFLGDALRTFEQDEWRELAVHAQLELAACHLQASDWRKYVRACAAVAAAPEMDTLVRCSHFDEMLRHLELLDKPLVVPFLHVFAVSGVHVRATNRGGTPARADEELLVTQDCLLHVELELDCNFPREVVCTGAFVSLEEGEQQGQYQQYVKDKARQAGLHRLKIHRHLDYRQDKQIASASVVCKSGGALRRADSSARPVRSRCERRLQADVTPLAVTPGVNTLQLSWPASTTGRYTLGQLCLEVGTLEFVWGGPWPGGKRTVQVIREEPQLRLDNTGPELLAGLPQPLLLSVAVGSYALEPDSRILLRCSKGLRVRRLQPEAEWCGEIEVLLTATAPNCRNEERLETMCELPAREHRVSVHCPWKTEPVVVALGFTAPFNMTHRLHTARSRKFLQLVLSGNASTRLALRQAELRCSQADKHLTLKSLNPSTSAPVVLSCGLSVSYMWEVLVSKQCGPLKMEFSVEYALLDEDVSSRDDWRTLTHNVELSEYETLYLVEASVEPSKGSEFCRVGALCHLRLRLRAATGDGSQAVVEEDKDCPGGRSLMYEVLAEPSVWAVCGRTAGVVTVSGSGETQLVTLDVMPLASGYLPLPLVRLSKYIPADKSGGRDTHPRLEPFSAGQVYNGSKGQQIHVLPPINELHN